jgi:hypothetical protein
MASGARKLPCDKPHQPLHALYSLSCSVLGDGGSFVGAGLPGGVAGGWALSAAPALGRGCTNTVQPAAGIEIDPVGARLSERLFLCIACTLR